MAYDPNWNPQEKLQIQCHFIFTSLKLVQEIMAISYGENFTYSVPLFRPEFDNEKLFVLKIKNEKYPRKLWHALEKLCQILWKQRSN
jgi:hypothetical protein